MTRSVRLLAAAALALATSVLHLVGTFMPIPPEQTEVIHAVATMEATMVPMPVGAARSYLQILNGNNLGTALLLLVCSLQIVVVARAQPSPVAHRTLAVAAAGLFGFALVSATHFFPVPAVATGVAGALCLVGLRSRGGGGAGTLG